MGILEDENVNEDPHEDELSDSMPELIYRNLNFCSNDSESSGDGSSVDESMPDLIERGIEEEEINGSDEENAESEGVHTDMDDDSEYDDLPDLVERLRTENEDDESESSEETNETETTFDSLEDKMSKVSVQQEPIFVHESRIELNENEKVYEWEVLESDDEENLNEKDGRKKDNWDIDWEKVVNFNIKPRSIIDGVALTNADKWEAIEMKVKKNIWIGDTGASTHMTNSDIGMYDWKPINDSIKVGNGTTVRGLKIGKLKVNVVQSNGKISTLVLSNVKYVPELWCNLFSITAAIDKDFTLGNKQRVITLSKGRNCFGFDQLMETTSGHVMAAEMTPVTAEDQGMTVLDAGREVNIMKLHRIYGHPGEAMLRKTAKTYNLKLKGKMKKCEECAIAKATQTNISKTAVTREMIKGRQLNMDISLMKMSSFG